MTSSTNRYLEAEVLTAPPQRLRLLLIDHAIRWAQTTLTAWQESRWDDGLNANMRCRDLIAELLAGVDPQSSSLALEVANVYGFLLTSVAEASLDRDQNKLKEVLRVLEIERETWRQVCERDLSDATPSTAAVYTPAPTFAAPPADLDLGSTTGGFSFEA